ncbi:Sap-like sulfolipid-1-addressing protein [Geodermatophilus tzadiensis]|uniref:Sap-like sulfolipid-1-addressing protein n=1 Tax=Geodermatophilus tzadiensis TaxID=1137988 RepID=A0A2T0T3J8_9ACTN|nr:GAP family protein [Geodermatophilus tzadiensis]PRY40250.1 Sap-like sulfolipid-1-addressing protein [Geodermatophilus tzadiensis]
MDLALLLPLTGLALVDSTSIGTLGLPLWLVLAPGRVRAGRVVLFLGTVAGAYLLLGVVLALGAAELLGPLRTALAGTAGQVVLLVAGLVLVVLGLTVEPWTRAGKERRRAARAARGPGRLARWRERAGGDAPPGAVVALAATVVGVEAATMLPYLAAIALLATAGTGTGTTVALLAGYCLLMVLPALVLLALRTVLHDRLTPLLARFEALLSRNAGEATAWVLFLLGLYLVAEGLPVVVEVLPPG